MAYQFNDSSGTQITVQDGVVDTTSYTVALPGPNSADWGQLVTRNFVTLVENFSNSTAPPNATEGQSWFDSGDQTLRVRNDTTDDFEPIITRKGGAGDLHYFVEGELRPRDTNTYSLGNTNNKFDEGWITTINSTDINVTGTSTLSGTAVINLADVDTLQVDTVDSNLIPTSGQNYNIGSSADPFNVLHVSTANVDTADIETLDLNEIASDIIPTTNETYDLGSSGRRFQEAHVNTALFTNTTTSNATVNNNLTVGNSATAEFSGSGTYQIRFVDGELASDFVPDTTARNIGASARRINIVYANEFDSSGGTVTTDTVDATTGNITTVNSTTVNSTDVNSTNSEFDSLRITDNGSVSLGIDVSIIPDNESDVGSSTNRFGTMYAQTFDGTATTAQYADLAERFEADDVYEPGTVVVIGGDKEVTAYDVEHGEDVLGVVTTAPAYLMNNDAGDDDTHPGIGLVGRVPVKVKGTAKKGHYLVQSDTPGVAEAITSRTDAANIYSIFGRVLEDKNNSDTDVVLCYIGVK